MASRSTRRGIEFIDGFVPAALRDAEPDRLSQARTVAIACVVSTAIHAATSIAMLIQGLPVVAAGNVFAALFSALLARMFSRGASIHLVSNGLLTVLLLFVAGVAGSTGGEANSALHTVTIVPGIAILLSGWRSGAVWMAIVCTFAAALGALRATGFEFPVQLAPEKVALSKYPGVISLTLGISAVILLSEWVKRRALDDLAEARRASEEAERERRHLEAAMLESQKLESLGLMAGGVAHDFNNLLTTILGNASLIVTGPREETGRMAGEIVLAAEQAAGLTDQLLAFAGRSRSVPGPFGLSDIVRHVESLAHAATAPNIDLRFELTRERTTVVADAGQIRQVVLNLVSNSCAAISGAGTVIVRTHAHGDRVVLEVIDDGCGMEETVRRRIFDPFFTTKPTGRGLGLSALQGIVRSHGGEVQVESEPGQGTTMRVVLPRVELPPQAVGPSAEVESIGEATGRALVVDDVEAVRRFAGRALRELGLEVLEARNGHEALLAVEAHPELRLVLLDATMPELGGEAVLAEIAKRWPGLPVILSTGDAQGFAGIDLAMPGFSWLPKPYQAKALQKIAANAIAGERWT